MNEAQRNEIKVHVADSVGYALHHMTNDNLHIAVKAIQDAGLGILELIDDEIDRAERREHENDTMRDDEKSEE